MPEASNKKYLFDRVVNEKNIIMINISRCSDSKQCKNVLLSAMSVTVACINSNVNNSIRSLEGFSAKTNERITAIINDRIVGFIDWKGHEIKWLMIAKEFQRRGIGTILINAAQAEIGDFVRVLCVKDNTLALSFYQKNGFKEICNNVRGKMFGVDFINILLEKQFTIYEK